MKIQKGDNVQIMLGKDNGKTGQVIKVFTKASKVLVEGVNTYKRHIKRMGQNEGGIFEISKPVPASNVMLVCPNCKKPTRVGFSIEKDQKVRICKKCGKAIKESKK